MGFCDPSLAQVRVSDAFTLSPEPAMIALMLSQDVAENQSRDHGLVEMGHVIAKRLLRPLGGMSTDAL